MKCSLLVIKYSASCLSRLEDKRGCVFFCVCVCTKELPLCKNRVLSVLNKKGTRVTLKLLVSV